MPCKNCKKHTGKTFTKKLALISQNKIKRKSKGFICLTEIGNKYDLKNKVKVYLQFLLTDAIKEYEYLLCKVQKKY